MQSGAKRRDLSTLLITIFVGFDALRQIIVERRPMPGFVAMVSIKTFAGFTFRNLPLFDSFFNESLSFRTQLFLARLFTSLIQFQLAGFPVLFLSLGHPDRENND